MCQVFGENQIKLKELVGAPFTYFTNYTSIARIYYVRRRTSGTGHCS